MFARVIAVSALLAAAGAALASDASLDRAPEKAPVAAQQQGAASAEAPRAPTGCDCCAHGRS